MFSLFLSLLGDLEAGDRESADPRIAGNLDARKPRAENQSVANISSVQRRVNIHRILERKARHARGSLPEYFIALPRLGSCIYMWTGRYRKRNAMYTVFPKYVRLDVTRSDLRFVASLSLRFRFESPEEEILKN